jgi:hypothetical protein
VTDEYRCSIVENEDLGLGIKYYWEYLYYGGWRMFFPMSNCEGAFGEDEIKWKTITHKNVSISKLKEYISFLKREQFKNDKEIIRMLDMKEKQPSKNIELDSIVENSNATLKAIEQMSASIVYLTQLLNNKIGDK